MPWQRHVLDVSLEIDPSTGRLAYRRVVLLVPRQSGKSTEVLVVAVHRALAWGHAQRIAYTAQTRNDARKKWEDDHVRELDESPIGQLRPKPYRVRLTNGNEGIVWANGSIHGLTATTEKSGHGPTLDLGFVDEAFAQPDDRIEQAYSPAMITRPDPQLWVLSTAGKTPGSSPYLWGKVEAGRAMIEEGEPTSTAYFEWSAADDWDRASPETWRRTMPALGHTQSLDAIAAEFDAMPPAEFDRAYLNRWNPHAVDTVIPRDLWDAGAQSPDLLNPVTFAVDVTPDRAWSAIAAVGEAAGQPERRAGEIVDHRRGTGWVVARMRDLYDRHGPKAVVLDPAGPAGALLVPLEDAGIPMTVASTRDHQQACGGLLDDIVDGVFLHRGQPVLDVAVDGAVRRRVGDSWLWSRTSSAVDISPLVALTLARWGHIRPVEDDLDGLEDFVLSID